MQRAVLEQSVSMRIEAIRSKLIETHQALKGMDADCQAVEQKLANMVNDAEKALFEVEPLMAKMSSILVVSHRLIHSAQTELAELKQLSKSNQLSAADARKLNLTCAIHNHVIDLDLAARPKYSILDDKLLQVREGLQSSKFKL